jgi:hypothetical protein
MATDTADRHNETSRYILVLLVLTCAIPCCWVAVERQREKREGVAARAIRKRGGDVQCEQTWLGKLLRDESLVTVTKVFHQTDATDAELAHLEATPQLQWLWLNCSPITDAGVAHLEGLSELRVLRLDCSKVTDAGLVHLEGLSKLRTLGIGGSAVTDAGLAHLKGLSQLQWLWVGESRVTDAGVKKLQQALPNCKIER